MEPDEDGPVRAPDRPQLLQLIGGGGAESKIVVSQNSLYDRDDADYPYAERWNPRVKHALTQLPRWAAMATRTFPAIETDGSGYRLGRVYADFDGSLTAEDAPPPGLTDTLLAVAVLLAFIPRTCAAWAVRAGAPVNPFGFVNHAERWNHAVGVRCPDGSVAPIAMHVVLLGRTDVRVEIRAEVYGKPQLPAFVTIMCTQTRIEGRSVVCFAAKPGDEMSLRFSRFLCGANTLCAGIAHFNESIVGVGAWMNAVAGESFGVRFNENIVAADTVLITAVDHGVTAAQAMTSVARAYKAVWGPDRVHALSLPTTCLVSIYRDDVVVNGTSLTKRAAPPRAATGRAATPPIDGDDDDGWGPADPASWGLDDPAAGEDTMADTW